MKILAIDPFAGIAGDMFTGALLSLGKIDIEEFLKILNSINLPGCQATVKRVIKNGITSCKFEVTTPEGVEGPGGEFTGTAKKFIPLTIVQKKTKVVQQEHDHSHRSLQEVLAIIKNSPLPEKVKKTSCEIFTELGKAEAFIHDKTLENIHFHEVGAADAIYDICAASLALHLLGVDRVTCGKVAVGSGTVKTAHGLLPVPTPATAKLLEGVHTFSGPAEKELTTPTGAAILKAVCHEFTPQVNGKLLAVGYGAGTMDFKTHANVLKVTLLEVNSASEFESDEVLAIQCNIDDMNSEYLSSIVPELLKIGGIDVTVTPCQMKKNRPGIQLEVLCFEKDKEDIAKYLLIHTSTFGVRYQKFSRLKLSRKMIVLETVYGKIEAKAGYLGSELVKISPEYENCRELAEKLKLPLAHIYSAVNAAAAPLLNKFTK